MNESINAMTAYQIHKFDTGPFNWYLIEQDSRLTVVDAGFPGHYRVLESGLTELGKSIDDVDAIVITHAHADHTGFAARLSKKANAPIYIHQADVSAASKVLQLPWHGLLSNAWRPFVASLLMHATFNGVFRMPTVSNSNVLAFDDDEVLDIPGRPQVIHVPGHTSGQIALLLPDSASLFTSDALVTKDLMTGRDGQPQVPHRSLNDDDSQTRDSLHRLRGLGTVTLLPGHGPRWKGNLDEAIQAVLA